MLLIVALLHAEAAFFYHFYVKGNLLTSMWFYLKACKFYAIDQCVNNRNHIMKLLIIATLASAMSAFSSANAANQEDMVFEEGTVLIRCMAPEGHQLISTELFNAGFPKWLTRLQKLANDGVVRRVHYLGELKEGLFIVIEATTKKQALERASMVVNDINSIMENAIVESGSRPTFDQHDACQYIEIGPVAVLPLK